MKEFVHQHKAEQWIRFIASFCVYPYGFSTEDWQDWLPRIAKAREVVQDEQLKNQATDTIRFFNRHFSLI